MTQPFDTHQLAALSMLAETGSVTESARRLHLTPSAISHALRALEREADCRLLERAGRKLALTQAGETLVRRSRNVLREMEEARSELRALKEWGRGRLRLAVSSTACRHLLPPVLREFKESFPRCHIEVRPVDTPRALELLLERRVDLAIGIQPQRFPEIAVQPLFTDELQVIISPLHDWAKLRRVPLDRLADQNLILYPRTSSTYRLIEQHCAAAGVTLPEGAIELGSMETIKELVRLNLGISVLAPWIALEDLKQGALVALPFRPSLVRQWALLRLRSRALSLTETTFCGICQDALKRFAPDAGS